MHLYRCERKPFTANSNPSLISRSHETLALQVEIRSQKDKVDNLWKTDQFEVRSIFPATQQTVRRLASAPPARHRFTVALSKGERIYVDRTQNGADC
jgi:hypothetical protein